MILVALDASGSVDNRTFSEYEKVAGDISAIEPNTKVIEFAHIAKELKSGRTLTGGTSFDTIEEFARTLPEYPTKIVVITDGVAMSSRRTYLHPDRWVYILDEREYSGYHFGSRPANHVTWNDLNLEEILPKRKDKTGMFYTLVGSEDGSSNITVFASGSAPLVAHSTHPNFDKIVEGARANDSAVLDLFDVAKTAATKFDRLTERVTTSNGRLYFDGVEVNDALSDQVCRFLSEGVDDWEPLVHFYENIQANPNEHSRNQLYTWLKDRPFTITPDGLIVGYKGVYKTDDGFESINRGTAIVDGEVHTGNIPNAIGSVVEMPRDQVAWDPQNGCSTGLHVGTYEYANSFARGALLEVHVNPRDVVSVPTDCEAQKVRTCRYKVVAVIDAPHTVPVARDYYDYDDEYYDEDYFDDEDICPDCGFAYDSDDQCECDDSDLAQQEYYLTKAHEEALAEDAARAKAEVEYDVVFIPDEKLIDEVTAGVALGVRVGDVFEDKDLRRRGRTFTVESIDGDYAVGKSQPQGVTRRVRLDRLTSRKYRKA
jgi:hypothetical protein